MFKLNAAARLITTAAYGADMLKEALTDEDEASEESTEESADASPSLFNIQNPVPNGMM